MTQMKLCVKVMNCHAMPPTQNDSDEEEGDSKTKEAEKKKSMRVKGIGPSQCAHCPLFPKNWIRYVASLFFVMYS